MSLSLCSFLPYREGVANTANVGSLLCSLIISSHNPAYLLSWLISMCSIVMLNGGLVAVAELAYIFNSRKLYMTLL